MTASHRPGGAGASAAAGDVDPTELVARVRRGVVGRRREIELIVAAVVADRHIVVEGPPGTGKSTVLRSIAAEMGIGFAFVEGNAELTPARLVGHFDPSRVLADGYDPDVFVAGPLVTAMRDGALLYIEELNRVPEETLNVLITVMSEGELHVPRLGAIPATGGFRLVAAMNPFDAVGTARISAAVYDRMCRVAVGYQDAVDEVAIVARSSTAVATDSKLVRDAVALVRATRDHRDLSVGSSVRGAIDLVAVAGSLAELRQRNPDAPDVTLDAALVALSGRVRRRDGVTRSVEEIIAELWEEIFIPAADDVDGDRRDDSDGDAGAGKAPAPTGASGR